MHQHVHPDQNPSGVTNYLQPLSTSLSPGGPRIWFLGAKRALRWGPFSRSIKPLKHRLYAKNGRNIPLHRVTFQSNKLPIITCTCTVEKKKFSKYPCTGTGNHITSRATQRATYPWDISITRTATQRNAMSRRVASHRLSHLSLIHI